MLELIAAAGPMAIPLWAVLAFSVAMYPIGFLFGVCSECCQECSNATCDGFDLEEAYSRRHGGQEFCGFTVSGNEITFSEELRSMELSSQGGYPIKQGCRVTGEGVPSGTVVTDVSRIWDGDLVLGPVMGCCRFNYTSSGSTISYEAITSEAFCEEQFDTATGSSNYSWAECEFCGGGNRPEGPSGYGVRREVITPQTSNGLRITLNNAIAGSPECLTFCGASGVCGPWSQDEGYGPYGGGTAETKRNCIRWVCRCYEGTGKRGDPEFPDPADWCSVVSTTVVGGPTTNDLNLSEALDAADGGDTHNRIEWDFLFGSQDWAAADGEVFCAVFAFVFYGDSTQQTYGCLYPFPKNPEANTTTPRVITSRDDYYTIHPCTRCL